MPIVTLNVSVTKPAKPSNLLKTGALVSVGGTTGAAGTLTLLSSAADLSAIKGSALNLSSLSWASGTVTATTGSDHGWPVGDEFQVVIAGAVPTGYNGTFTATSTGAATFTYPLATDPGTATTDGTATSYGVNELQSMVTSFFAQGTGRAVYVLELGKQSAADAVSYLADFIAEDVANGNTYQTIFSYLVPREFDSRADFQNLCNLYTSPASMVNFFVTTTLETYEAWVTLAQKNVFLLVESPDMPVSRFDCAAPFQSALNNNPGSANIVPPMAYRFMYGTTVYPVKGNASLLATLTDANVNYIGSGAEGGLSNMILNRGHMQDGNPFNFWYSVAWCILNLDLNLANEIINGSNTTANPLYYDQQGIDRLQKKALATMRTGISYGLLLGTGVGTKLTQADFNENFNNGDYNGEAVVNAIPFANYISDNPSAYDQGDYGGLSAVVTPKRGFETITFNLSVTNFVG